MGENSTERINLGELHVTTVDNYVVMNAAEFAKHVQRVNMLCNLVDSMMKALIQTPFGAMLPPEIVQQVRSL